jgi:hypothetical protein
MSRAPLAPSIVESGTEVVIGEAPLFIGIRDLAPMSSYKLRVSEV